VSGAALALAVLAAIARPDAQACTTVAVANATTRRPPWEPWRAHEAAGVSWLKFGLDHRSRFEHLRNDFRESHRGDSTAFSMRTLLTLELDLDPLVLGVEGKDSRAWTSAGTPVDTTHVDPLELLQAYVQLRGEDVVVVGDSLSITGGRITMDFVNRRLVARNEFRNTINAFAGLDVRWEGPRRAELRSFVVMPVVRLPSGAHSLRDNRIEFDRTNTDALLWGAQFVGAPVADGIRLGAFVIGLHEQDSPIAASAERQLVTPGLRAYRSPEPGRVDFDVEVAGQFGRSRASTEPDDREDLTHLAFGLHASTGYRFDTSWKPRMALMLDVGSGDRDPDDGRNGRFDTLFGARRFDFGPTGFYGALARRNAVTPGWRLELEPHRRLDAFAAYRLLWLASAKDSWTTASLRDRDGTSGTFVGQQIEGRVRVHFLPKNLALDLGGALFVRGRFARDAAEGGDPGAPAVYVYTQLTATI